MKKKMMLIAAFALALATPMMAFAADANGKDACLLNSENCPNRSMSIVEIIAKLKTEIGKGSTVYTSAELETLNSKLAEYQVFLERMQSNS